MTIFTFFHPWAILRHLAGDTFSRKPQNRTGNRKPEPFGTGTGRTGYKNRTVGTGLQANMYQNKQQNVFVETEPAEPEPGIVGTEPNRTEPFASCAGDTCSQKRVEVGFCLASIVCGLPLDPEGSPKTST